MNSLALLCVSTRYLHARALAGVLYSAARECRYPTHPSSRRRMDPHGHAREYCIQKKLQKAQVKSSEKLHDPSNLTDRPTAQRSKKLKSKALKSSTTRTHSRSLSHYLSRMVSFPRSALRSLPLALSSLLSLVSLLEQTPPWTVFNTHVTTQGEIGASPDGTAYTDSGTAMKNKWHHGLPGSTPPSIAQP